MLRFILTRVSLVIPTFLGIAFLAFVLIRLVPGDPIVVRRASAASRRSAMPSCCHRCGFDQPIWSQFADYVGECAARRFRHLAHHANARC